MNKIHFRKMSGAGNDFILIDNRQYNLNNIEKLVRKWCQRRTGIGADGLILIEESEKSDFAISYFNADGGEAALCGNGTRCAAMEGYRLKLANKKMQIQTKAGIIECEIIDKENVKIAMPIPTNLRLNLMVMINQDKQIVNFVNIGVPHTILFYDDIEKIPLLKIAPILRHHSLWGDDGANVNIAQIINKQTIKIRTYERGVENETLACGTGATATAYIANILKLVTPPIYIKTASNETLTIHFLNEKENIEKLYLEGPTKTIYEGIIR